MSHRWIKCPNCCENFRYDYKDPNTKRGPVVDPNLSPKEKRKAYAQRFREKHQSSPSGETSGGSK